MSLREFLEEMEAEREVLKIEKKLSPKYQIPAVMKALDNGPILIFEKVKNFKNKVVANVCATRKRLFKALKTDPEHVYEKLVEAWKNPRRPKIVKKGAVLEVSTEKANLHRFPILTHFEKDAGPYITSAVIYAKSPDGSVENVSVHRLLLLDKNRLAIRLVPRHLYKLWDIARKSERDLEVAISIGVHPAVVIAATSPLPFGINEFHVANTLLNGELELVKCPHVDAVAPAEAEIVLEGKISSVEMVSEGPLVDITGTYDIQRNQPVVEVVGIIHREDYIYHAILPSGNEHRLLMGFPREAKIWQSVSNVVPRVKAVNLTGGGCGWLHALISIEKQTDGDAKNALLAAFSAHPSLKHAVVVDADINVYDLEEVEWALATRFQADEDLLIIPNVRGSSLDPSADQETCLTTKMGVDATRPLNKPREKFEKAKIPLDEKTKKVLEILKKQP